MLKKVWKKLFPKTRYIVLDVGTTGIKAFIFDKNLGVRQREYKRISKSVSADRIQVEQDPKEILAVSIELLKDVYKKEGLSPFDKVTLGITNQRETTVVWNKNTGETVYPAISWEDSRTHGFVETMLSEDKHFVKEKTGLQVEPYFSATKIKWILENIKPYSDELLFGTLDTWLLWNLTSKKVHFTDYTNASRTLLFDIKELKWSEELLSVFGLRAEMLPKVLPSSGDFGLTSRAALGFEIPCRAVCGDQQSSLVAAGTSVGTTKITFGTGVFILQIVSDFKILEGFYTTLAAGFGDRPLYAVETKINGSGERIDKARNEGRDLENDVTELARGAAGLIKKLPIMPEIVVADGGITNYIKLIEILKREVGLPIKKQKISDGTAYGVGRLLQKNER